MKIDDEIFNLKKMVVKMGEQVNDNLRIAMNNYYNYDSNSAALVNDDLVDSYERVIEETCLNLMLKERPYGKDLRFISGVLTLVSDIERLGDHAEDIINFAYKIKDEKKHVISPLDKAFQLSMEMTKSSLMAFVDFNIKSAENIIKMDDEVDKLYQESIDYIIQKLDKKEMKSDLAVYSTLIVKYIERIADHAVNVCEWIIYIYNGYYKDKQMF